MKDEMADLVRDGEPAAVEVMLRIDPDDNAAIRAAYEQTRDVWFKLFESDAGAESLGYALHVDGGMRRFVLFQQRRCHFLRVLD